MQCPKCSLEAYINSTCTEIEGDDSPQTQTRVYTRMIYHCRNPRCTAYGTSVGEIRHQSYPEQLAGAEEEVNR